MICRCLLALQCMTLQLWQLCEPIECQTHYAKAPTMFAGTIIQCQPVVDAEGHQLLQLACYLLYTAVILC